MGSDILSATFPTLRKASASGTQSRSFAKCVPKPELRNELYLAENSPGKKS